MTFGILALGFPVSQPLGAHSLTFFLIFPILMHSLGDVWHPGSGVPCFGGFGGSQSHFLPYLPYLNAFLRWRLASWLWGSLFRRIWGVSQPLGAHSLTFFLIFPILMHSLGDVWHPGSGVPCFGGFGGFAAFGGSQSHFLPYLPYLSVFLRWRLASWLWGSLFRRIWGVSQPLGGSQSHFLPYLPYLNAFLRWRLASWL